MLTYVHMGVGGGRVDRDDGVHVRSRTEKGYGREDWPVEPDREVRCARRCVKLSLWCCHERIWVLMFDVIAPGSFANVD